LAEPEIRLMTISKKARLVRNSLVREALVDMADRDYLAARICWRTRLPEQFLWNALQAIEKQLKAILVLNDQSAKGLGHDLEESLKRVMAIKDLRFDPPEDVRDFVRYLNRHGPNRYLERPFYLRGAEIFSLDKTFWHFRRYCQNLRAQARAVGISADEWLRQYAKWFKDDAHLQNPHKFRLFFGYLEDVLKGRMGQEQYDALVWKNVFYGKRDKGTITFKPLGWMANPAHVRHPDVFAELAAIVDFPKDVRREMSSGSKKEKSK
jgi:HEPN domain-containing protein